MGISAEKRQRFERAIDSFSRPLYVHIRSIVLSHEDANDVLQNTFLKAWNSLEQFNEESKLQTWLYRIATNEALQHLRKAKVRKWFTFTAYQPVRQEYMEGTKSPEYKLEKALETLSPQQRSVFGMKYYNELKYSEIAQITGLAEGTLKAVFHQAVQKIKKNLGQNE